MIRAHACFDVYAFDAAAIRAMPLMPLFICRALMLF